MTVTAEVRSFIFERDGNLCQICKASPATEVDHIWPASMGGTSHPDNLQAACKPCNRRKRATIPGAMLPLHVEPPAAPPAYEDSGSDEAEPVGVAEIADRLGLKRQTVAALNMGGRMPEPRWVVSGSPAWNWPDIRAWAKSTGRA